MSSLESIPKEPVSEIFPSKKSTEWKNKSRTLVLSSRGVSQRHRHLMLDIHSMLPHGKKESKLEKKELSSQLNELCSMHSCNYVLYFESRKKQDLYLWIGKAPSGPSIKFMVENIHTTDELKLTGNSLKGTRPILSFDGEFDSKPHWKLTKEILIQSFNVPKHHPKTQPFIDRVFNFTISDGRIWFRNYQIFRQINGKDVSTELFEIGPRFVLNPIRILDGNINGMVLYQNPDYMSKTEVGKKRKADMANKYIDKTKKKKKKENYLNKFMVEHDNLNEFFEEE